MDVAHEFTPQEVTSVMWAQATLFRRADMILDHTALNQATEHRSLAAAAASATHRSDKTTLPEILLQRVAADAASFGAFEVSNILWAVANLKRADPDQGVRWRPYNHVAKKEALEPPVLTAVEARCCDTMSEMTAHGVTNILWALVRVHPQPSPRLQEKLVVRALELLRAPGGGFSARGVARSLEAIGILKMDSEGTNGLAGALLQQYLCLMRENGGEGVGGAEGLRRGSQKQIVHGDDVAPLLAGLLLNAQALRASPPTLAAEVLEDLAGRVPHFAIKGAGGAGERLAASTLGFVDLSSALASIAELLVAGRDYELLRQTAARSLPWTGEQGHLVIPHSRGNVAPANSLFSLNADEPEGLVRLHSAAMRILQGLEDHVMNSIHTFSAAGVSNTFFAFALLGAGGGGGRPSDLLVAGLSVQANARKRDFTSSEVATMLWSLAVLQVRPDPVLSAAMVECALHGLQELSPEEMGMIIWALGVLDLRPDAAMLRALESKSLVRMEKPDEVTQAMWALCDLSPRLLLGLAQMAEQRMPSLSPRLASSVMWALARLGFLPDARLVQTWSERIASSVESLEAPELADVWWALGKLALQIDDELLGALMSRSSEQASYFSAAHVADSFWGLARLRVIGARSPATGSSLAPEGGLPLQEQNLLVRPPSIPGSARSPRVFVVESCVVSAALSLSDTVTRSFHARARARSHASSSSS